MLHSTILYIMKHLLGLWHLQNAISWKDMDTQYKECILLYSPKRKISWLLFFQSPISSWKGPHFTYIHFWCRLKYKPWWLVASWWLVNRIHKARKRLNFFLQMAKCHFFMTKQLCFRYHYVRYWCVDDSKNSSCTKNYLSWWVCDIFT